MSPTFLQIVLLGLVQGLAELLPVSSSAHVIVVEKLFRLDPSTPAMAFLLVMLHTGTMGAVIVYFQRSWRRTLVGNPVVALALVKRLVIATGVTLALAEALNLAIGHILRHGGRPGEVEDLFSNLPLMAVALAAAGVLILVAGLRTRVAGAGGGATRGAAGSGGGVSKGGGSSQDGLVPCPRTSVWIGILQGLSLPFRGFSRSGVTISAGLLGGLERRSSEEFSFALAILLTPLVIAHELHRLVRTGAAGPGLHLSHLLAPGLLGLGCSFLAGLLALRWLSGWLEKGRWHYFGIYCLAAAGAVAVLAVAGY